MTWFYVKCAACVARVGPAVADVFRVDPLSGAVEVRHRRRRPGPNRTRWVPIKQYPRFPMFWVARCDRGHGFLGPQEWEQRAVDAAFDAVRHGAEYGVLDPDSDPYITAAIANGDDELPVRVDADRQILETLGRMQSRL